MAPENFGGYFRWTLLLMIIITGITAVSGDASLTNTIQQIIIYAGLAIGYDYFSGFTGDYNLGFSAFVAIGAYVFALSSNAGLNLFLALILAGVVTAVFSAAISYPFLRLRGAYFAIATLAMVLLLYYLDINLPQFTHGLIGLYVKVSVSGNIELPLLVGSLLFLLLSLWTHHILSKSKMGLALRSMRENEEVTESLGVHAFRIKQYVMILSGFFGGIGGAILAMYFGFINADNVLGLGGAFFPVVAAMTGGSGIFLGPVVGSFILVSVNLNLPSFINSVNPSIILGPLAISGFLLLIVGLFFPAGLLRIKSLQKYAYFRPDRLLTGSGRNKVGSTANSPKYKKDD